MDIKEIKKGIAYYSREQTVLMRLIRKLNGLSSSKFDELFQGREYRKHVKLRPISGDSFMLGVASNGFTEWAWWLELLQYMMAIDLVDTKRVDGELVYILPS